MPDNPADRRRPVPIPHLPGHEDDPDYNLEFLWVYEPPEGQGEAGKIHLLNANDDPVELPYATHDDFATDVTHPDRQEGYAYSIRGGWRITTADNKKVDDPQVVKMLLAELGKSVP